MNTIESKPTGQTHPFRVLVVEDDRTTYTALMILLKHYRFTVDVADTLAVARQKIVNGVDLICLDLMLPDGDGITLLEELKLKGSKIPVIVTTATEDPGRLRKVRNLMPEKLIHKPVDFLQMLDVIKRAAEANAPSVKTNSSSALF